MRLSERAMRVIGETYHIGRGRANILPMDHIRNWGVAVLLLIALAASYAATRQANDAAKSDAVEVVRAAAEMDCVRTSERSALVLAFKERSAQGADDRSEGGLDDEYRALARGGALLIPIPASREAEREFVSEVTRVRDNQGRRAYRLTRRAVGLIRAGCEETYRP